MKVKSQKSKVKSGNKNRAMNAAIIAAILALLMHGVAFSIPAYFIYANSKVKSQKSKVEQKNDAIVVDVSMLPAIKASGEKSVVKQIQGKKPAGQEDGLAGQAEKKGSADAEKEMLTYENIIKQKIQAALKYPAAAKQKSLEGRVGIVFTILKQGQLKNVEIIRSSGNEELDEAAITTVKNASPFPEIPADYAGQEWTRPANIIFNLE